MADATTLEFYLDDGLSKHPGLRPVGQTVRDLAGAGQKIAAILALGGLGGELSARVGDSLDGDGQKALDVMAHDILREALCNGHVRDFASEEAAGAELNGAG